MVVPQPLHRFVAEAGSAALFVDFDGSLSPIVDDPAAARVLPAARAALARLVPLIGRAAVVSGRPVAFLRDALEMGGLLYVGAYGLERVIDDEVVLDPRVEPWVDAIARAADEAEVALPGLLVERKGQVAVTLHWRTQPHRGAEAAAWAQSAAQRLGLEAPLRGRMAVELRPPIPVDKGTVVTELAQGASVAAFAGDDEGDLAAFAALRRLAQEHIVGHAVSIGVTSPEGPAAIGDADVVVAGPPALAELLDALAAEISARG